jgi:hypothetical protein
MYVSFGLIDPRSNRMFHVGCTHETQPDLIKLNALPAPVAVRINELKPATPHLVILQSVTTHPEAEWVKWSIRFRRDILTKDWKQHKYLVDLFTNSKRTRRFLGEEIPSDADQQAEFLDFDRSHPEIFEELLHLAEDFLSKGNGVPGVDVLVGMIRSENKFRISNAHKAYYARKLLMEDPRLLDQIAIVLGVPADELVLADGRSWREFATEHFEDLRFASPYWEDEEERDWTY